MARPEVNINWTKVNEYLEAGCDGTEVAAMLGIHPNTLYVRCESEHNLSFSDYRAIKRAKGDSLLRKTQFDIATKDRDKSMLIWLGKNRLGQTDKQEVLVGEVEVSFTDDSDESDT